MCAIDLLRLISEVFCQTLLMPAKLFLAEARWAVGKSCSLAAGNASSDCVAYKIPTTSLTKEQHCCLHRGPWFHGPQVSMPFQCCLMAFFFFGSYTECQGLAKKTASVSVAEDSSWYFRQNILMFCLKNAKKKKVSAEECKSAENDRKVLLTNFYSFLTTKVQ